MFNASIVLYQHSPEIISPLLKSLREADGLHHITLIDNSPRPDEKFRNFEAHYISRTDNPGYGAAHNIALRESIDQSRPYHLVVNPDIELNGKILDELIQFMEQNRDTALVMPKVFNSDGSIQYLCKLLPSPADLFFRRFLINKWGEKRNRRFELRDSGYNKVMEVPYLSGSFMLLRTSALEKVGLFDERFFMYPEDIDLSRRLHSQFKTQYYPYVSVVHHHARESYKNRRLLWIHIRNIISYFNKWGWFFDKERRKVNRETLDKLNML